MSTLTPRLQFTEPAISDPMTNWDAEAMNVWEKVDNYAAMRRVVSPPSGFFVGELIHDDSTSSFRRWTGSTWAAVGREAAFADSYETSNVETDTFAFTTGSNAIIYGAPFPVIQNHRYHISFCAQLEWQSDTTNGEINLLIRVRASATGDQVNNGNPAIRTFSYTVDSQSTIATPVSGAHVYQHTTADAMLSVGIFGIGDGGNDWHVNASPGAGGGIKPSTVLIIHDCGSI